MKDFLVRTLLVAFFLSVSSAAFAERYNAPYRASYDGGSFLFNITTPKGWTCTYDYEEYKMPLFFFRSAPLGIINMTHTMFMAGNSRQSLSAQDYINWDLADIKKRTDVDISAKKVELKLDNAQKWKDYALYEITGIPNRYKELMLVIQTEKANIYVIYAFNADINDSKNEKVFQENSKDFYEMIKTIEIIETAGWLRPIGPEKK